MFAIIEKVNPYHARFHYRGEEVVKRDGATPVQWILNNMTYPTEQDAKDALWQLAKLYESKEDCLIHSDKSDFEHLANFIFDETGELKSVEELGYKGDGIYYNDNDCLMMKEGDSSFEFDVESFFVEEVEEVDGHFAVVI